MNKKYKSNIGKRKDNIYITVKLPEQTVQVLDEIVKNEGFTSRTDALKYLVRQYSKL